MQQAHSRLVVVVAWRGHLSWIACLFCMEMYGKKIGFLVDNSLYFAPFFFTFLAPVHIASVALAAPSACKMGPELLRWLWPSALKALERY